MQSYPGDRPEYDFWILRIKGAEKIREAINTRGLADLFKVPKKWIYLLPQPVKPEEGYYPKYSVLVEEDMQLYSSEENRELWKGSSVSYRLLQSCFNLSEIWD